MADAKESVRKYFELMDMGPVKWLLGIHVERDRASRTISLSQEAYIDSVVGRFNLEDGFKVSTPLDPNVTLTKELGPDNEAEKRRMSKIPYRSAVGSLMYASMATRPDITFTVQHLSQFFENPGQAHWTAAQRAIRYLNATKELKLILGGKSPPTLLGYTDADWASNVDDRKSTSGYAFSLGGGAISWSSKKQGTVAGSSCEAEYVAADHSTKEALWLRTLLRLLGYEQKHATTIHCDNQGAIALTKDPNFHARTKHIDVKHHFVRDTVEAGEVKFEYIPTSEMTADILTKGLARPKHWKFLRLLGLRGCNAKW
jgi:hypothetical protein